MAAALMSGSLLGCRAARAPRCGRSRRACAPARAAAAAGENLGFKTMRRGIKEAADETVLTPRFYTTDFDEMEELFSLARNPGLPMDEFEAMLSEFKTDYNQTHFVRNETFKRAADGITGDTRKIFIEFLERSCTAEFSGFLLYKELGRRLKKTNPVGARPPPRARCAGRPGASAGRRGAPRRAPCRGAPERRGPRARAVAEIFTLMSRDEARHAGFLNKAMSDFNLALDLGFLTKNRKYTFYRPQFIFYATYLSEKARRPRRRPPAARPAVFQYVDGGRGALSGAPAL